MTLFTCSTLEETLALGTALGKTIGTRLNSGISIAMTGDLGAGKTTFVQGMAKGLEVSEDYYITSPTFSIINEYPAGSLTLCHLDLYRMGSVEELDYIGFEDLLDEKSVIVVEWPGLLEEDGFSFDLTLTIDLDDDFSRQISFLPRTDKGSSLLTMLKERTD